MKSSYWVLAALTVAVLVGPSQAGFVNGDFETGDFTGWTHNGGFYNGNYPAGGSLTFNGIHRNTIASSAVLNGKDPFLQAIGVSAANAPTNVYNGNFAAKVENESNGALFSQISQTAVWTDPDIFFAFRVVLEDPNHLDGQNPFFAITLRNITDNTDIFAQTYNSNNLPATQHGTWLYTDWIVQNINTAAHVGDTLQLTLIASDCSLGGHGGYAVLDGFGAVTPPAGVPEPASLTMLGFGALGLAGYGLRRRKNAARKAA